MRYASATMCFTELKNTRSTVLNTSAITRRSVFSNVRDTMRITVPIVPETTPMPPGEAVVVAVPPKPKNPHAQAVVVVVSVDTPDPDPSSSKKSASS